LEKNEEVIKEIFSAFLKMKKFVRDNNTLIHNGDIKPSEQILLLKMSQHMKDNKIIINDIVNILELAPPTISLTLNSLEDHGYIERTLNKDNRREIFVSLTNKGKKMLDNIKEKHYHFISKLIDYLGEDDTKNLIFLLNKTTKFLEDYENDKEGN
jgi:DNA-binding MarR family transcriptional regulator